MAKFCCSRCGDVIAEEFLDDPGVALIGQAHMEGHLAEDADKVAQQHRERAAMFCALARKARRGARLTDKAALVDRCKPGGPLEKYRRFLVGEVTDG